MTWREDHETLYRLIRVTLVFAVVLYVSLDYLTAQQHESDLNACARGNLGRVAQVHFFNHLIEVNQQRVAESQPGDPGYGANVKAIVRYKRDRAHYVAAQADVAQFPDAKDPVIRVVVNCGDAYPDPVPGIFS